MDWCENFAMTIGCRLKQMSSRHDDILENLGRIDKLEAEEESEPEVHDWNDSVKDEVRLEEEPRQGVSGRREAAINQSEGG